MSKTKQLDCLIEKFLSQTLDYYYIKEVSRMATSVTCYKCDLVERVKFFAIYATNHCNHQIIKELAKYGCVEEAKRKLLYLTEPVQLIAVSKLSVVDMLTLLIILQPHIREACADVEQDISEILQYKNLELSIKMALVMESNCRFYHDTATMLKMFGHTREESKKEQDEKTEY